MATGRLEYNMGDYNRLLRFIVPRCDCRLCLLLLMAVLSGCHWNRDLSEQTDSDLALETLISALDAWKSGEVQGLKSQPRPIRFIDDDQLSGGQLIDYELDQGATEIAPFQNVNAILVLKDRRGGTTRKPVTYQVVVDPELAVLRSDN